MMCPSAVLPSPSLLCCREACRNSDPGWAPSLSRLASRAAVLKLFKICRAHGGHWNGAQLQFGDVSLPDPFSTALQNQQDSNNPPEQLGTICPDCSAVMQLTLAQLLLECCSCGCTFCARCSALYLPQPTSVLAYSSADGTATMLTESAGQQQQTLAAAAAALRGLLATCSCGAVDSRAVEQQWGPAAIAYWPTGQLQHQLLLLLLLQQHQQQAIPLLSRSLLQRLQDDWRTAESAVLTWQHVQAAAQEIVQQQQLNTVQLSNSLDLKEQQQQEASNSLQVIPTAATPAFHVTDGGCSMLAHTPMDMELCNGPADAAQQRDLVHGFPAAVAAAAATRAVSEPPSYSLHEQQQLDYMQVDDSHDPRAVAPARVVRVSANLQRQQQQEVRLATGPDPGLAVSALAADAAALLQAADGEELFTLAHQVTAADPMQHSAMLAEQNLFVDNHEEPWTTAAVGGDEHQPFVASSADSVDGCLAVRHQSHQSPLHSNGIAADIDADNQLGMEDFEQPQPSEQLPQPSATHDVLTLQAQQQPVMRTVSAMLAGNRNELRLIEAEVAAGSRTQVVQAAVPQLSDFGLKVAPPPVLPDDPVVLIDDGDDGATPFLQRS